MKEMSSRKRILKSILQIRVWKREQGSKMALEEASGKTGRNPGGIHASDTLKMGCRSPVGKGSADRPVTHPSYVQQVQERGPEPSP